MRAMDRRIAKATLAAALGWAAMVDAWAQGGQKPQVLEMPAYAHVFVIIEENHTTDEIVPSDAAPNLTGFAQHYGYSWRFYAETHPSEPKLKDAACPNSMKTGYVDHTVSAPSLVSQLAARHLTWKGYFEDIPAPG